MPELRRFAAQGFRRGRRDVQRLRVLPDGLPRWYEGIDPVVEFDGVVVVHDRVDVGIVVFVGIVVEVLVLRHVLVRFIVFRFIVLGVHRVARLRSDPLLQLKGSVLLKGFKEFILRGNVIDLAVAVVIGAAFTAIVTSIVTNLINPLISAFFNASDLDNAMVVTLNGSQIRFGAVLGSIITFLIVAVVVYFAFVLPLNAMKRRTERLRQKGLVEPDAPITELDLLTEIRDLLQAQQAPPTSAGKHADAP